MEKEQRRESRRTRRAILKAMRDEPLRTGGKGAAGAVIAALAGLGLADVTLPDQASAERVEGCQQIARSVEALEGLGDPQVFAILAADTDFAADKAPEGVGVVAGYRKACRREKA